MATSAVRDDRMSEPTFRPPGPGSWQQDPAHWPRPLTPWTAEVFPGAFARGFAEGSRRYGLLLDHLEAGLVHGWVYYRAVPAVDPAGGEPAAAELERRLAASREAFETRRWREDLALWDERVKPDSIRRNRALQAVDVSALADADLAAHLAACRDNHEEMVYRHHKFNMAVLLPVGTFVARAAEWTGLPNGELLGLLRGSSPLSNGIAAEELRAVGRALSEAGIGPESFPASSSPASILERLRNAPDAVGRAARAYLDACGLRVASGYDVSDLTAEELPDTLLQAFWVARHVAHPVAETAEAARALARVRRAVPAEHREGFEAWLAEARRVHRLRDERGVYNDLWAAGIARRAIREAGRRLALRGRLDHGEQVFEADFGEMIALLGGGSRPTAAELAARAEARLAIPLERVPAALGEPPPPPPSLDGLPEHARDAARALATTIDEILGSSTEANDESVVRGRTVSPGSYEGRARVVLGPADFNRLRRGDVLVTPSTSAAFNVVLPLLGAVVTDRGGLLSHAAIVAREYGIPGVVGTRDATRVIPDGARVRVDGARGRVEVIR